MAHESTTKDWKLFVCSRLVDSAINYRKDVEGIAKELERYDNGDCEEWYQTWLPDAHFAAKVNKVQQYKREVGSRLHNTNPTFEVTVKDAVAFERDPDNWLMKRARAEAHQDYLNYCTGENDFFLNSRETLEDSFVAWGVMWIGIDKNNPSIVTAEQDSWKNVYFDPDAKKQRDGNYIIRRRFKPRWWLMEQYPNLRATIMSLHGSKRPNDRTQNDLPADTTTDMVEYFEMYLKIGLHNYADGRYTYDPDVKMQDRAKKYIFVKDELLIDEAEWETPFHRDGQFPCEVLYYYPNTEGPYPVSPLRPGIGWLRAINWCITLMIAQYGFSSKQIIAFAEQLGLKLDDEAKAQILYSADPVVPIALQLGTLADNNTKLSDLVQQFKFQTDINASNAMLDRLIQMFEQETGLYEFLNVGTPDKQDRSAAATNLRDRYAMSRIDDMRNCLDNFMSKIGRKMDLCAMYHMDPEEDIGAVLGPDAAEVWGVLVDEDEIDPQALIQQYSDEGVRPEIATELVKQFMARAVTMKQWYSEADFDIELGSLRRKSPEEKEQANLVLANQLGAVMADAGMPAVSAELFAAIVEQTSGDPVVTKMIREIGARKQQLADSLDAMNLMKIKAEIQAMMMQAQAPQPQPKQAGAM